MKFSIASFIRYERHEQLHLPLYVHGMNSTFIIMCTWQEQVRFSSSVHDRHKCISHYVYMTGTVTSLIMYMARAVTSLFIFTWRGIQCSPWRCQGSPDCSKPDFRIALYPCLRIHAVRKFPGILDDLMVGQSGCLDCSELFRTV